jgi:hypothetical protein
MSIEPGKKKNMANAGTVVFDSGLFGCFQHHDCGVSCCLAYWPCCCLVAHRKAVSLLGDDEARLARRAWRAYVCAGFFPAGGGDVGEAVGTGLQLLSDLRYIEVRRAVSRRVFGVFLGSSEGLQKVSPVYEDEIALFCVQCFCAPCARCQETSAIMKYRENKTGKRILFQGPCGFQEEGDDGIFVPVFEPIPKMGMLLAPVPLLAIRA